MRQDFEAPEKRRIAAVRLFTTALNNSEIGRRRCAISSHSGPDTSGSGDLARRGARLKVLVGEYPELGPPFEPVLECPSRDFSRLYGFAGTAPFALLQEKSYKLSTSGSLGLCDKLISCCLE